MFKRMLPLLALVLVTIPVTAQAQALKVGYTDADLLIANMPQFRQIQQQLQQEAATEQQALAALEQEFQQKLERYQTQQALLSDESRAEREQELMQLQNELQQSAMERQQGLAAREQELLQPLFEQVEGAISEVAQAQTIDLVLRSPGILYVDESRIVNITLDVARRLGIQVDEEAAPGN